MSADEGAPTEPAPPPKAKRVREPRAPLVGYVVLFDGGMIWTFAAGPKEDPFKIAAGVVRVSEYLVVREEKVPPEFWQIRTCKI